MRFYIATKFSNAATANRVAAVLEAAGHERTFDWTKCEYTADDAPEKERVAAGDLQGVRDADLLLFILPAGIGSHTELGVALGMRKRVLLCASAPDEPDDMCPFYHSPLVTHVYGAMDEWLRVALAYARQGWV